MRNFNNPKKPAFEKARLSGVLHRAQKDRA
jgi:hypothetical protein